MDHILFHSRGRFFWGGGGDFQAHTDTLKQVWLKSNPMLQLLPGLLEISEEQGAISPRCMSPLRSLTVLQPHATSVDWKKKSHNSQKYCQQSCCKYDLWTAAMGGKAADTFWKLLAGIPNPIIRRLRLKSACWQQGQSGLYVAAHRWVIWILRTPSTFTFSWAFLPVLLH